LSKTPHIVIPAGGRTALNNLLFSAHGHQGGDLLAEPLTTYPREHGFHMDFSPFLWIILEW
jgi:hypothetical protein